MQNFKKIIAICISLVLIVTVFSSCGKKKKKDDNKNMLQNNGTPITINSKSQDDFSSTSTTIQNDNVTTTKKTETGTKKTFNFKSSKSSSDSSSLNGGANSSQLMPNNTVQGNSENTDNNEKPTLSSFLQAIDKFQMDLGYGYDAEQGIYYSLKDSWQREALFMTLYDDYAPIGNMIYRTVKADFTNNAEELDYRIQMWKGNYGVFRGAEIGVYTKSRANNEVYQCADPDHELQMHFDLYDSEADWRSGNRIFYRDEKTWWLTGFKFGVGNPAQMVLDGKIVANSFRMVLAMEKAFKDCGFRQTYGNLKDLDTFVRNGNEIHFVWRDTGSLNY